MCSCLPVSYVTYVIIYIEYIQILDFIAESLGYIAPRVYEDIATHIAKLMLAAGSDEKRDQFRSNFSSSVVQGQA